MSDAERTPPVSPPGTRVSGGIVVGVDGSDEAAHAYRWAVERAERFGPVRPVTAWHHPWWYTLGAPLIAPDGPGPDIEREAGAMIDRLAGRTPADLQGERVVARGPAGRILVDVAEDADLLVVGTRGRGPLADHVLGSVSGHCAAHSPVPVVVVPHDREGDAPTGLVLVGLDGSAGSAAALEWALEHAQPGDRIVACRAWAIPVITGYEALAVDPEVVHGAALEAAEEAVASACERAGIPTDRVEVRAVEGDARQVLEDLGAEADLIVVGRQGHGLLPRALLGSVTTSLAHRPVAPLAVVPPPAG